jgi:hypothetical protein
MVLCDYLFRILPKLEISLMYCPLTAALAIFIKLRLWSDLYLMANISLNSSLHPEVRLQLVTNLSEGFTLTSPAHRIKII